jgi:hypothetical protein
MTHILLGEWGFLDNLDDSSGNGLAASANFTPTYIDGPVTGTRAIRFTATGQTVDYGRTGLEPDVSTGGVCTMAWIKVFSAHTNYTAVIHKSRAFDSTRHAIDVSTDSVFFMSRWRDQLVFKETGNEFVDRGWHHICNVDSDGRYAWFVDGALVQEAARTGTAAVNWEPFPWKSGFAPEMDVMDSAANVAFTGIRIFSGTLSNSEVVDWMNAPILAGRSGKPKIWSGSAWTKRQAAAYNGSSWSPSKLAGATDDGWVTSK